MSTSTICVDESDFNRPDDLLLDLPLPEASGCSDTSVSDTSTVVSPPFTDEERAELFERFLPLVNHLLRKYSDNADGRQDLQGEIYLRFHDLLEAFDPSRGIPLTAYLVHQLKAGVYTYARQRWTRQKRETSLECKMETGDAVLAKGSSADPSGEWVEALHRQEIVKRLPELLEKLSERQRQVLVWRYYEAKSYSEIAALLKIEESTARSLLRHGMNALRRLMTKEFQ